MPRQPEGTPSRPTLRAFWRVYEFPVISTVAVAAYVLGCWGFAEYSRGAAEPLSVFEILYRSLRLFVLHGDPFDAPVPWPLELGRFMAPLATALTAIAALSQLLHHQLRILGIRLRRPEAVVCGLGRKGLQLVRDLRAEGNRVVVIERDAQNEYVEPCRDLGAVVLEGDATRIDVLRRAGAERADQVFATCGDDGVNVDVAVHVYELYQATRDQKRRRLKCRLHIVDPMLCEALKSHGMFHEAGSGFSVRASNIFESSARLLLEGHPLDREFIASDDPRVVHLVIIGFGKMGQAVALQAAKTGHYANGKRLRLTIVDRQAGDRQRGFLARYPQFGRACDVQFIESDFESGEVFRQLREWGGAPETLSSVAVCLDDDSASLRCALALAAQVEGTTVPVFVRMEEEAGLASLLKCRHESTQLLCNVHSFGQIDLAAALSRWIHPWQDELAKATHERFRRQRAAEGRPPSDSSMRDWSDLDEGLKDSNRQFADHIPVKLRAIRCLLADAPPRDGAEAVTRFSTEEAHVLARMEHARWNAERFLAGWQPGPSDKPHKISPYLVDWAGLPPEIRKYDYDLVALIPELTGGMKLRIFRTGEVQHAGHTTPGEGDR
jgi:hypothetical protein